MTPLPSGPAYMQRNIGEEGLMSEEKLMQPLVSTPEDPLTAVPMDYIGFRTA